MVRTSLLYVCHMMIMRPIHAVVDVIPSVIEPSFGIGRIMYAILEHSFNVREGDEQRVWLSLPPCIAPISCSILPLSGNEKFDPFVQKIGMSLHAYLVRDTIFVGH